MEGNIAKESGATSDGGKSVRIASTSVTKRKNKKIAAPMATSDAKVRALAPRSPRASSAEGKLVCRYCGSDDLSPSFKKRRDARCRACFKKRYGSAAPSGKTARSEEHTS